MFALRIFGHSQTPVLQRRIDPRKIFVLFTSALQFQFILTLKQDAEKAQSSISNAPLVFCCADLAACVS
jgi:hypothetical protein